MAKKEKAEKKKSDESVVEAPSAEKAAPKEAAAPKPQTKSVKIPKLAPKNKSRLPRKQKKALQRAANKA